MIDQAIAELAPVVGTTAACQAVGRPRATHYRWHRQSPPPPRPERVPAPQRRALHEVERKQGLAVLHSDEHVDEASATVHAKLLDQGIYLASTSSMSRILRESNEVRERRRHATLDRRMSALAAALLGEPDQRAGRCHGRVGRAPP